MDLFLGGNLLLLAPSSGPASACFLSRPMLLLRARHCPGLQSRTDTTDHSQLPPTLRAQLCCPILIIDLLSFFKNCQMIISCVARWWLTVSQSFIWVSELLLSPSWFWCCNADIDPPEDSPVLSGPVGHTTHLVTTPEVQKPICYFCQSIPRKFVWLCEPRSSHHGWCLDKYQIMETWKEIPL